MNIKSAYLTTLAVLLLASAVYGKDHPGRE